MSYTPDDPLILEAAQIASYAARFVGEDTSTESFLGKLSRAEAQGLWAFQKRLQRVSLDSVPNSQSTYAALATWAFVLGLPDGQGGYGPQVAIPATGLQGIATGTIGAPIPAGTQLAAPDGTLFETTALVNVSGLGTVTITFNALTGGSAGNLQIPATLAFISPPVGVASTVTLTLGATNGADLESVSDLLARILNHLQIPPMGGTINDWDNWAKTPVTSVDRAYGYPLRGGTGTVDEVVTYPPNAAGSGPSRLVSGGDLATIAAYIDTVRPVTVAGRRVLAPDMPGGRGLTIRSRIVPFPAGAFDWSSNTLGFTVDTYSVGTGMGGGDQLTLSADAPADLQNAITAGLKPRIQVVSTGTNAPIVALQARVIKYTSVAGPKAKLDLELSSMPAGWVAPNVGDKVYSGGPAVPIIGAMQLGLVNSLGPSKLSGYADSNDPWQDVLEIAQLMRIVLVALDNNGAFLANNVVFIASIPQITIAVGAGSPSVIDFTPTDSGGASAPEMAYAKHIAVTD